MRPNTTTGGAGSTCSTTMCTVTSANLSIRSQRVAEVDVCRDNLAMRTALLAIVTAVLGTCVACGTSGGGMDGDCTLRVRLNGKTYDATVLPTLTQDLIRQPRVAGDKLPAEEIDCDGSRIDDVEVQQIQGVDLADAVYVDDGSGERTPYFNTTLRTAPLAFRAATLPVPCNGTATFSGRLDTVGDQDYGTSDLSVPYVAQVLASDGTGLPFQEWAAMQVQVHVTAATSDPPDRADIDAAINDRDQVEVSAHCEGSSFVADTFTVLH